mmetsp:Transcript_10618/g.16768  ORF Transcript_10618/g.16768 Transcript_10618/m.16768 type:complete len:378 (+) Transcript_10618:10-1143(+)
MLEVSEICLGTMTFGLQTTQAEAHEQLNYAFDECGINFLDTSEVYPSPSMLGTHGRTDKILAKWLAGRNRDDVVLAASIAGYSPDNTYMRPPGLGGGRNGEGTRLNAAQIEFAVDRLLGRMGVDHLDLLQFQWPDRYVPLWGAEPFCFDEDERDPAHLPVPFEEQLAAVQKLVKKGKVRALGLGNETPYGVGRFLEAHGADPALPRPAAVQCGYSLLSRNEVDAGLVEALRPRNGNLGLLAYSPLGGGALAGKYVNPLVTPDDARMKRFPGYYLRFTSIESREAVSAYTELAKQHGLSCAELALAWNYNQPHVSSTIVGATSLDQLKENIGAYQVAWTEELADAVHEVYSRWREPARGVLGGYVGGGLASEERPTVL